MGKWSTNLGRVASVAALTAAAALAGREAKRRNLISHRSMHRLKDMARRPLRTNIIDILIPDNKTAEELQQKELEAEELKLKLEHQSEKHALELKAQQIAAATKELSAKERELKKKKQEDDLDYQRQLESDKTENVIETLKTQIRETNQNFVEKEAYDKQLQKLQAERQELVVLKLKQERDKAIAEQKEHEENTKHMVEIVHEADAILDGIKAGESLAQQGIAPMDQTPDNTGVDIIEHDYQDGIQAVEEMASRVEEQVKRSRKLSTKQKKQIVASLKKKIDGQYEFMKSDKIKAKHDYAKLKAVWEHTVNIIMDFKRMELIPDEKEAILRHLEKRTAELMKVYDNHYAPLVTEEEMRLLDSKIHATQKAIADIDKEGLSHLGKAEAAAEEIADVVYSSTPVDDVTRMDDAHDDNGDDEPVGDATEYLNAPYVISRIRERQILDPSYDMALRTPYLEQGKLGKFENMRNILRASTSAQKLHGPLHIGMRHPLPHMRDLQYRRRHRGTVFTSHRDDPFYDDVEMMVPDYDDDEL